MTGPDGNMVSREFCRKAIITLGILHFLVGVLCAGLALPRSWQEVSSCSPSCRNSGNNKSLDAHDGFFDLLDTPVGMDRNRLSITITASSAIFMVNGAVGIASSVKPRSNCLKLFDFCLAILTEVLSIFGMVICTAAAYLEGSRQIHHHAVYFIAGMEVGCYLASVVSLAVIFACWIQMSARSCSCNCICADTTCSYGDHQVEGERRYVLNDDNANENHGSCGGAFEHRIINDARGNQSPDAQDFWAEEYARMDLSHYEVPRGRKPPYKKLSCKSIYVEPEKSAKPSRHEPEPIYEYCDFGNRDFSVAATGIDSVAATGIDSVAATGIDSVAATGINSVAATGIDSVAATQEDQVYENSAAMPDPKCGPVICGAVMCSPLPPQRRISDEEHSNAKTYLSEESIE